jgi:hypothetical protein
MPLAESMFSLGQIIAQVSSHGGTQLGFLAETRYPLFPRSLSKSSVASLQSVLVSATNKRSSTYCNRTTPGCSALNAIDLG